MGHTCDALFDALCERPRRVTLLALARHGERTVGELTARLDGDPRTARLALVHAHLPRLADAGYVEWNRDADVVSPGRRLGEVEPVLDAFVEGDAFPGGWP